MGSGLPHLVRQAIWLAIWWFIAFPISGICATLYIALNSISACVPQVKDLAEALHQGVNFTARASRGVVNGDELC